MSISASLMICERYLDKPMLLKVANSIRKFQHVYEDSWNAEKRSYEKTMEQVAEEVVKLVGLEEMWVGILFEWNWTAWNDVGGWAELIIKAHGENNA